MTRRSTAVPPSTQRGLGLGLAALTAVISGVSVFVNASAVREFGDPILFTTLKNGVAAVLLAALAVATVRGGWQPTVRGSAGLVALGIIGGSVPFMLFFSGLAQATAPAAAVIHKTLFALVAVLAVVFLRERLGALQVGALAVLLASQLLIQTPVGVGWGTGETFIAIATVLWALEVILAKRVLGSTPSPVAATARMGIGLVVLVGYLAVSGGLAGIWTLGAGQWGWVLLTGALLSGYVATWYAALRRAPASAVTAVLTLGAPLTAGLQLVGSGQAPAPGVAAGYGLCLLGVAAVAWLTLRRETRSRTAGQPA